MASGLGSGYRWPMKDSELIVVGRRNSFVMDAVALFGWLGIYESGNV